MGEYSRTSLISILFLFLLIFISISSAKPGIRKHYKPCKTLVLYFHDIMYNGHNAANATSIIAAAPEGGKRTLPGDNFNFGYVIVFDDPVTLDSNLHSPPIGRAQGMYTYDSKVFFTSEFGFSFVLNSTDYKGTINCFGADPAAIPKRDISVMGGTGDFFMHRGIATLTTDAIEGVAYFRLRVDIKFYECW